jgi:hypothetical protein
VTGVKDFATGTLKLDGATLSSLLANKSPSTALWLPGANGNSISCPDKAALHIVGDIDIRLKVGLADWTPATTGFFIAKLETAGQFAWDFALNGTGAASVFRYRWSADGTAVTTKVATVATGVTDGSIKWVRVTHDVDNGASGNDIKFWLSDDNVTYTQVGATVTTAGTTSIYPGTSNVFIGDRNSGDTPLPGTFYRAIIKSGIAGTTVADWDGSVPAARYRDAYLNLWTVNGTANAWMVA